MFGKKKNTDQMGGFNNDIRPESGSQAKPKNEPVYTMPEKFMQSPERSAASMEKPSGKKRFALFIGVSLAVAAIAAAASVFFLQQSATPESAAPVSNPAAPTETPNLGELVDTPNTNEGNLNVNSGTSINLNVDPELEQNINAELFGNTNTSEVITNTNSTIDTDVTAQVADHSDVPDSRDKDKDDLTDIEEELYTTKNHLPDNDRDGYVDGVEVANLYSPLAADEGILDSGRVIEYENDVLGWTIYYPSEWLAEPLNSSKQEVLFTSPDATGEFIQVLVEDNSSGYTAVEWYDSLFEEGGEDLEQAEAGDIEGVVSADGLRYYFATEDRLISVIYNIGLQEEIAFRTTFQMMVNSFVPGDLSATTVQRGTQSDDTENITNENTLEVNANQSSTLPVNSL